MTLERYTGGKLVAIWLVFIACSLYLDYWLLRGGLWLVGVVDGWLQP